MSNKEAEQKLEEKFKYKNIWSTKNGRYIVQLSDDEFLYVEENGLDFRYMPLIRIQSKPDWKK